MDLAASNSVLGRPGSCSSWIQLKKGVISASVDSSPDLHNFLEHKAKYNEFISTAVQL